VKPGAARLDMGNTRPPDQRAIAKNPKIAHIAKPYQIRRQSLPI
jgi:hypothetical protein